MKLQDALNIQYAGIEREEEVQFGIHIYIKGIAKIQRFTDKVSGEQVPYKEIEIDYDDSFMEEQIHNQLAKELELQFQGFELGDGSRRLIGFSKSMKSK